MLSTVDTGEADTAQAKTPSRTEQGVLWSKECSPELQGRIRLLKREEDLVPLDPDLKFPFPKGILFFEINPEKYIHAVYTISLLREETLDLLIER
jgi:hypothetical protein